MVTHSVVWQFIYYGRSVQDGKTLKNVGENVTFTDLPAGYHDSFGALPI